MPISRCLPPVYGPMTWPESRRLRLSISRMLTAWSAGEVCDIIFFLFFRSSFIYFYFIFPFLSFPFSLLLLLLLLLFHLVCVLVSAFDVGLLVIWSDLSSLSASQSVTSPVCDSVSLISLVLSICHLGRVLLGLFQNRNSWNKPNNCSFSGYSHSRVAVKPS